MPTEHPSLPASAMPADGALAPVSLLVAGAFRLPADDPIKRFGVLSRLAGGGNRAAPGHWAAQHAPLDPPALVPDPGIASATTAGQGCLQALRPHQ